MWSTVVGWGLLGSAELCCWNGLQESAWSAEVFKGLQSLPRSVVVCRGLLMSAGSGGVC